MSHFNTLMNTHQKNLELYVPVVARVHGPSHPVFYEVQDQYNKYKEIVESQNLQALKPVFIQLQEITNQYEVPSDTCETYAAVYEMLKALDQAYFEEY